MGRVGAAQASVRPQHPDGSVDRAFDRQTGLIRGGTRLTAPIDDLLMFFALS